MRVILFDRQPDAAAVWEYFLRPTDTPLVVSPVVRAELISAKDCSMVIVDQSAISPGFTEAVEQTAATMPNLLIVATGKNFSVSEVASMMRSGVAYVLEKPLDRSEVKNALEYGLSRANDLARRADELDQLDHQFATLTSREREVLTHVLKGVPNREAAEILQVSVRTVESRRAKVYRKLQANNVAELVRKADRLELLRRELRADESSLPLVPEPTLWFRHQNTIDFNEQVEY